MGIYFRDNWAETNTCATAPAQETLRQKLAYALTRITDRAPQDFRDFYISKGLHQEEGGSVVMPEYHITIETPSFPNLKRYHLYFLWFKHVGWHPSKLTHVTGARIESLNI